MENKTGTAPKVSVIIPVYNVEKYLEQCLDSVLNQTLRDIEVICVDDGSTDNSLKILHKYAALDKRMHIVEQKNKGAGAARNKGMSVAQGEYLSFLDSDDFFELNMLETMYQKAEDDGSDIVVCGYFKYDQQLGKDVYTMRINGSFLKHSPIVPAEFTNNLFEVCFAAPWSKLFKRELLIKNKLQFENLKSCNDFTCVMTAEALANQISCIDEPFTHYRANTGTQTSTNRFGRNESFIHAAAALERNLQHFGLYDKFYEKMRYEMNTCLRYETQNNILLLQDTAQKHLSERLYNDLYAETTEPKVSVIIPVYNVEKYLEQCLDSVLNQTLRDIEVICVDDGSTDNSPDILHQYAARDARVKIINQKNEGAGKARNVGIEVARGQFIAFMDSDDYYPSVQTLQTMYDASSKSLSEICGGSVVLLNNGRKIEPNENEQGYVFHHSGITAYKDYQFDYGYWRFIYNRKFLKENNLYFPDYLRGQDPPFFVKAMSLAKEFYALKEATYVYRQSIRPIQWTERKVADVIRSRADILSICKEKGYDELYKRVCTQLNTAYFRNIVFEFRSSPLISQCINEVHQNNPEALDPDYLAEFNLIKGQPVNVETAISVIICVYNTEEYLNECLKSVCTQTLQNIEIICVDDGSTDGSLKILKKYADKDERIKIIEQENQGLSVSRNNALKIAQGDYIVFIDADDFIISSALEKIYQRMQLDQLDMLSYSGVNFESTIKYEEENKYWGFHYMPDGFNCRCFNWSDCRKFMTKMAVSSCLTAYKRSFIVAEDLLFPPHLCFEDNLFFIKAITKAQRVGIMRDKLYHRRIHSTSITQNWNVHFADYLQIATQVLEYLRKFDQSLMYQYARSYCSGIKNRLAGFSIQDKKKYKQQVAKFLKQYSFREHYTIDKHITSYKLFGFLPLWTIKRRGGRKTYKLFGFPIWKVRKMVDSLTEKYYFCGLPLMKKQVNQNHITTKYKLFGLPFLKISRKTFNAK